ncbi:hypothetical protein AAHZ94_24725 [Streptomyces sp. HSW2009]|uniref:hypothetical protein n=1 Tax=Streptomyces sp. HSW2009 TaxID=3142890 RepID=UPI0032EE9A54
MTVTWRTALSYALTVAVGAWLVGAGVDLAWSVAAGGLGAWFSLWVGDPLTHTLTAVTVLALTLARRIDGPLPTWRVPLVDGSLYLLVLLVGNGLAAWWTGAEGPADTAFALASFALLDLQLPAAWALSAWRARHLRLVIGRSGGGWSAARDM